VRASAVPTGRTFIPTRYLTTIFPGPNAAGVLPSQQLEKANSY
jgi:hypothetical protein